MKFFHSCRDGSPNFGQEVTEEVLMRELFEAPAVAFDIETISLEDRTPIGFALATSPYEAFYFPPESEYLHMVLEAIVANPAKTKYIHNAMFDVDVAYKTWNVMAIPCHDTMLMCAHLNLPMRLEQAGFMVGRSDVVSAQSLLSGLKKDERKMTQIQLRIVAEKCCIDAQVSFALALELQDRCNYEPYWIDMNLIPVLVKAQAKGMRVDQGVRAGIQETLEENVQYYKAICDGYGFSPTSSQQVAYTLMNRGVILPMKWDRTAKKMKVSTRVEVLEQVSDPLAQLVLLHRKDSKLLSTYVRPLEDALRAYTHFHMSTITGRLGSANMNLQNWPEKIRMMLIPDEDDGEFTIADANQLELRVLAHLSHDPVMEVVFNDPNGDIHVDTMKALNVSSRRTAKDVNFGMIFGASPPAIDAKAKCGIPRAAEFMELWFDRYQGARDYILDTQEEAKRTYHVSTPMGRKIYIKEFEYMDTQAEALRKAINYPIQGGAAEINKKSMPLIDHLDFRLQVHDNFLFNGRVELPDLEHVVEMFTPYKVEYTRSWE